MSQTTVSDPALSGTNLTSPSLEDVIRAAMRNVALDLRVAMPCAVSQVHGNQLVDVQPLLQAKYMAKTAPQTLRIIPNVLVSMPMGSGWSIKYPLAIGDTGYCIFADRSLDAWAAGTGGIVDPDDGRTHDLMDAIFVPGLVPMGSQSSDQTSDLVLTNGAAQMRLEKTGKFQLTNGTYELIQIISQLVASYETLVAALPKAFVPSPTAAAAAQDIADVGTKLVNLATAVAALQD